MKLYKEASLMMLPTSVKDGKLYSIFPQDGDGDFTFSRGSNLAATRINEQGLIEKGRENLFTYSNEFDNTSSWSSTSLDFTSSQSGYDGSNDAYLIERTDVNSHLRQTPPLGNVLTISIYAKANTLNWIRIRSASVQNAYFNLNPSYSGDRVGFTQNIIDANIEDVGDGWFRCSVVTTGYDRAWFYPVIDNNDVSGASGSIYIQNSQVEVGLVATDYIESGATTGKAGVLEDLPRLNWGDCPSLLLEPSRQNLVDYSEDFSQWINNNTTEELTNSTLSPEGKYNAYKIIENSSNAVHSSYFGSLTTGVEYTISVFAKAAERSIVSFGGLGLYTNSEFCQYDLINGTAINTGTTNNASVSIENYGNGWYRCIATYTSTGGSGITISLLDQLYTGNASSGSGQAYQGDNASGAYFYGAQVEQGSYATSYIPTHGTSVTRSLDLGTNSDVANELPSTGYTVFFEVKSPTVFTGIQAPLNLQSGTTDRISPYFYNGNLVTDISANGVTRGALVLQSSASTSTIYKVAISVEENNIRKSVNGSTTSLLTDELTIPVLSSVRLGSFSSTSNALGSTLHEVTFFPTALSDNECINLTTI